MEEIALLVFCDNDLLEGIRWNVLSAKKENLYQKKIDYLYEDLYLGKFEADVCNQCGEAFFTENAMNKIEKKAKEIGIRGLERKTKISRSGNSLIIRIPKAIAEFVGAKDGTSVTIRPGGKSKLIVAME